MKTQLLKQIEAYPVIPVFYHEDLEICKQILDACYAGGIRVFEFVNRGPAAKGNFAELLKYKSEKYTDLNLGIGTLLDAETATDYLNLGAEFLVSPIFSPAIAELVKDRDILWIPGCMTPTEIAMAMHAGCGFIKLFPGDSLGPDFLKSIKPLFPSLKFMPTGGVNVEESNIKGWFDSGVSAVGLGSKLLKKTADGYSSSQIQADCQKLLAWAKP